MSARPYVNSIIFCFLDYVFSQAIIADNTMYMSGMIGFIPSTMEIVQGGAGPEADQVCVNVDDTVTVTVSAHFGCIAID